ncbi:MAG TPA: nitroreductase family deazaflavin-dependent oxidoreductase [Chloroflexia bacterium]|nr:nitroreductase family deazaflavin-dependent oxidoreductase [Chloroflexia bacterium]
MTGTTTTKPPQTLDLRPELEPLRQFSKRTLNPLVLRFAGKRFFPFGVLHHVGRNSGKRYETPVGLARVRGGFVMALTYGADVDWARNLRAAGHGTLVHQGRTYRLTEPRVIGVRGRRAFPLFERVPLTVMRIDKYLLVRAEPAA